MFVDDCVYGTRILMRSDVTEPLNVGSAHLVTINELVSIVEGIAGLKLRRHYKLDAPQGVRGRNSDNTLVKERLGWEPEITLEDGLEKTYAWMYEEMAARGARKGQVLSSGARV
jgi:nucleoside-diphosphate-sugar epimerase